jgi:transcriptional regulator with XRE-family HTH domain
MDKLSKARLKKFGQRLAELRKEKKQSLRELAALSGIDHKKINDIELAKRGLKLETLFRLADGLGIQPKELLDFDIPGEK